MSLRALALAAIIPAAALVTAGVASADPAPVCHDNAVCAPVDVQAPVHDVSVHDVFVSINNLLSGN